jgi:phospholipid transport system transporter-binding protein
MKVDATSITNANANQLLASGLAAIRSGDVAVDLSGVKNVDSAAVALLLAWQRAATAEGKRLTFAGVPEGIVSLAELYSVHRLLGLGAAGS